MAETRWSGPAGGFSPSRIQTEMARAVMQVMAQAQHEAAKYIVAASARGLAAQLTEAERQLNKQQRFVRDALVTGAFPPALRRQLHQEVGEAAQRSTVQSYTHRPERRGTAPYRVNPHFDKNRRYANGALLRALQASDFFEATENRLLFINIARLNQEAVQWKRLNFGAGTRATEAPGRFAMEWGNFVGDALGIDPDPQPAFRLPKGFWFEPGAGSRAQGITEGAEFYPVGEAPPGRWGRPSKARMTRGIVASNFLDAGVRRIAQEYPRGLSNLFERAFRDPRLRQRVEVRAQSSMPRPAPQRFGFQRLR